TSKAAEREDWFADRAMRYGLNLRAPFRIIVVDGLKPPLNRAAARAARLAQSGPWAALVGQAAEEVILVVQDSAPVDTVATALVQHMNGDFGTPRVLVSGAGRGAAWAARAFADSQDALSIAAKLNPSERVIHCETLGFLLTLYRAGPVAL